MTLVAAVGVDVNGDKRPLGLVEGATENAATVQALIDDLVERGLDPRRAAPFIIDGSRLFPRRSGRRLDATRPFRVFRYTSRNVIDRLPKCARAIKARPAAGLGDRTTPTRPKAPSQSRPTYRTRLEDVAAWILEGLDECSP